MVRDGALGDDGRREEGPEQPLTYPLEQLAEIVGAVWLFLAAFALIAIACGAAGNWIARRHGRMCPHCDYRGSQADLLIHRIREHERE